MSEERWKKNGVTIGEGGQGHIHEVTDRSGIFLGCFAKKTLKNKKRRDRFEREVIALRKLRGHAHVVELVDDDIRPETKLPFYVVERGSGSIEKEAPADGYSILEAQKLFREICIGVKAFHDHGIIHRDIKPDNIIMCGGVAKIGDPGLCFIESMPRITPTNEAVGPRYYMAPELESGREDNLSVTSDIYSVGKMLYWLLSGGKQLPREKYREKSFRLSNIRQNAAFDEFDTVFSKSLSNDERLRASSIEKVLELASIAFSAFYNRPEWTLEQKKAASPAATIYDASFIRTLSNDEVKVLMEALENESVALSIDALCVALEKNPKDSMHPILKYLASIDDVHVNDALRRIVPVIFSSNQVAEQLDYTTLFPKVSEIRRQIIEHAINNCEKSEWECLANGAVLAIIEEPDLTECLLDKVGHPKSWPDELIANLLNKPSPEQRRIMQRIRNEAKDNSELYLMSIIALSNDTPEGINAALNEITDHISKHGAS